MQNNANELDADRAQRLAKLAVKERADAEAEEAARQRNHRAGGRADFLNQANRKAGELDLGERVSRGRQAMGMGRDVDM